MANEKLLIEIVLDDGSVKQGFARVQTEAQKAGQATQKAFDTNPIKKNVDEIGTSINGLGNPIQGLSANLRSLTIGFGLAAGAVATAGVAIRAAFDAALNAERIDQINRSFDVAAQRAGLFGQVLRSSLDEATGGVVDFEGVLQQATIALNELGTGVQQYPDLLRAARAASIAFGGDTARNFELLNQAILSGRTRSLQQIGLFIDQQKAADDYAKSLGTTADRLTESGQRQATLNAILQASQAAYAGVNIETGNLATSTARVGESFNDLFDRISAISRSTFGGIFQSLASQANDFANSLRRAITPLNELSNQEQIAALESRLKEINVTLNSFGGFRFRDTLVPEIAAINKQLSFLRSNAEFSKDAVAALRRESEQAQNATPQVLTGLTEAQAREAISRQQAFNQALLQIDNEARQQSLNANLINATEEERLRLLTEEAETQHKLRLAAIDQQFANQIGINQAELSQIRLAEQARFQAESEKLKADSDKRVQDQDKKNNQVLVQAAQAARQALTSVISQAFQSLGASLTQGAGAFSNFRNAVINIIGDLLINIGQSVVAAGLALFELGKALANPTNPFSAIAGGAALIALGGALKSLANSNANGSTAAPAPTFSGGPTDVGGQEPFQPAPQEDRERRADTNVQVVIQGDVLDSDSTSLKIVELLNNAFDKQGATIRRGAIA